MTLKVSTKTRNCTGCVARFL